MSLEQRLIETLHRADDFEPSPDLFARVERSLEEDLRHRRRMNVVAVSLIAGAIAVGFFLRAVISVSSTGLLIAPGWALELLVDVIKVMLILVLGPILRRFGQPLIADVFRLDPSTGKRFVSLLDIAFYLVLFGEILFETNIELWNQMIILAEDGWRWTGSLGSFLMLMGVAHATTIAALPLIGLFHSSLVRRARRRQAGPGAPPVSAGAEQAEKVVRFILWGIAGMAMLATLVAVGLFFVSGFVRS